MWPLRAAVCLTCVVVLASASPDPTAEQQVSVTVEGVEGDSAAIPCDLFPTDPEDKVNLILWYKDKEKDPIYSYDARRAVFASERHHLKDLKLKGRVSFSPSPGQPIPHTLTLARLLASDAGRYSCRVDFMRAQSTTRVAELRVVSPVDSLIITDGQGHPVPPVLTPIPEGGVLNITCTARGGRPPPKVSWWFGDADIDDVFEIVAPGVVSNTLEINPLTRAHAHSVLTCKAATAPVAVETATVTIDMHLRPISVEISGAAVSGPVRAGDMLDLTCTTRGSRPQPVINWYKGPALIHTENTNKKVVAGVGGTSHVRVKVDRRDNGARITCRATNPKLPLHTLQEHTVINVTYAPEVELRMGAPIEGTTVTENTDLYLICHMDANPPPHTLVFMHEDTEVHQDKASQVLINGNNLVLNNVQRTQAGQYACKATNSEGTGTSPPVNITVRYAPVCAEAKDVWAEPGATIRAMCRVHASPEDSINFSWVWVTSSYTRRVIPSHITSDNAASTVEFTVPRDNGTTMGPSNRLGVLQCWARNTVGKQATPCFVAVRKPAPPAAPVNCNLTGAGREVVTVNCQPGDPPSMPQTYRLQIYESKTKKLYHNVTSSTPRFVVRGLTSGHKYLVYVSSHTQYGRSPYRLVEDFTYKTAENRMPGSSKSSYMPSLTTIIMFVSGVSVVVAAVLIMIVLVRCRKKKDTHKCIRRTTSIESHSHQEIPKAMEKRTPDSDKGLTGMSSQLKPRIPGGPELPKETLPLQPIIRQPSKTLQPIIKENGRSDGPKGSQGRTVLFVEPPKSPSGGILVNRNEVPRNTYDAYPPRRHKDPNGDVQLGSYGPRGSYDAPHSLHRDSLAYERDPMAGRYRVDDDDAVMGQPYSASSTSLSRDAPYSPRSVLRPTPSYPREYTRDHGRDHPRDLGREYSRELSSQHSREFIRDVGRDHERGMGRGPMREHSRDLPRDPFRHRDLPRDPTRGHRDRDPHTGHFYGFPTRIASLEYDRSERSPPPSAFMKKSPSVSGNVGQPYDYPRGEGYRSLPRPGKHRDTDHETMVKYRSLDRRFDLPFSGPLRGPEPESGEETPPTARRYSGSPRLRFADEKHFHVYHDKEKKQDGLDDMDESFV